MNSEPDFFIELNRAGVICPNIQSDVIKSVLLCIREHILIKSGADVPAAHVFVNAQIVDIKRLNICEVIVVHKLLEYAKSIAHNLAVYTGDKNRGFIVLKNLFKFGVGVFFLRPA